MAYTDLDISKLELNKEDVSATKYSVPTLSEKAKLLSFLEKQNSSIKNNPSVKKNISNNLKRETSSERKQYLKMVFYSLKETKLLFDKKDFKYNDLLNVKQNIFKSIIKLKKCYESLLSSKDINTLNVLEPLLKCQYYKYKILKQNDIPKIPAIESDLLNKLKNSSGLMLPIEKSVLYQTITLLNSIIVLIKNNNSKAILANQNKDLDSILSKPDKKIDLTDFDPIQANRQILKLKSKIQRTYSEKDKKDISLELDLLLEKQKAYNEERIINSIKRSDSSLKRNQVSIDRNFKLTEDKYNVDLDKTIDSILQSLKMILRLSKTQKELPNLFKLFDLAIKQLVFIKENDFKAIINLIIENRQIFISSKANKSLLSEFNNWYSTFKSLIKSIIVNRVGDDFFDFLYNSNYFDHIRENINLTISEIEAKEIEYFSDQSNEDTKYSLINLHAKIISELPISKV